MLMTILIVLHVIICLGMILIVLIQTSKGGLDSTFGGVASDMLGAQGANDFVKNWTKILFGAFVISCILLAVVVNKRGAASSASDSILQQRASERVSDNPLGDELPLLPAVDINEEKRREPPAGESQTIEIGGENPVQIITIPADAVSE